MKHREERVPSSGLVRARGLSAFDLVRAGGFGAKLLDLANSPILYEAQSASEAVLRSVEHEHAC